MFTTYVIHTPLINNNFGRERERDRERKRPDVLHVKPMWRNVDGTFT